MKKDIGKTLKIIDKLDKEGKMTPEHANKLREKAVETMIGIPTAKPENATSTEDIKSLTETAGTNKASVKRTTSDEQIEIDARPSTAPASSSIEEISVAVKELEKELLKALMMIEGFKHDDAPRSAWHPSLSRDDVADGLTDIVNNPDGIYQNSYGFCGPAAFFNVWFRLAPVAATQHAIELFEHGKAYIGSRLVEPGHWLHGDNIRKSDYSVIKRRVIDYGLAQNPPVIKEIPPPAQWMIMGALKDASNDWFQGDYEGYIEEIAGIAPQEITKWLEATKLFSSIRNETYDIWGSATNLNNDWRTLNHLKGLNLGLNTEVILLIDYRLIQPASTQYEPKPNHWVLLRTGVVDVSPGKFTFDVWSWGDWMEIRCSQQDIETKYFGAIICER